jgi:hypothetical protein
MLTAGPGLIQVGFQFFFAVLGKDSEILDLCFCKAPVAFFKTQKLKIGRISLSRISFKFEAINLML